MMQSRYGVMLVVIGMLVHGGAKGALENSDRALLAEVSKVEKPWHGWSKRSLAWADHGGRAVLQWVEVAQPIQPSQRDEQPVVVPTNPEHRRPPLRQQADRIYQRLGLLQKRVVNAKCLTALAWNEKAISEIRADIKKLKEQYTIHGWQLPNRVKKYEYVLARVERYAMNRRCALIVRGENLHDARTPSGTPPSR